MCAPLFGREFGLCHLSKDNLNSFDTYFKLNSNVCSHHSFACLQSCSYCVHLWIGYRTGHSAIISSVSVGAVEQMDVGFQNRWLNMFWLNARMDNESTLEVHSAVQAVSKCCVKHPNALISLIYNFIYKYMCLNAVNRPYHDGYWNC